MATVLRRTSAASPAAQARPATIAETTVCRVGFWSAVLTAVFYIGWLVGMAASFVLPKPLSDYAPMVPSVFIPFGWVPLIVSVHRWASEERRIFAEIALAFAIMYGALLAMNYFVVLTVTIPHASAGGDVGILAIKPQSFFLAVEAIGYTCMTLSALFAAFVFKGPGLQRWIYWMLLITGVFVVALPLQMFWSTWPSPPVYAMIPREFTLTTAVILLAVMFHRRERPSIRNSIQSGGAA